MSEVVKRAIGGICVAVVVGAVGAFLIAFDVDAMRDIGGAVVFCAILAALVCIAAIGIDFLRTGEPNRSRNERMRYFGGRAFIVGMALYVVGSIVWTVAPDESAVRGLGIAVAGIAGLVAIFVALPLYVWGLVHATA